MPKSNDTNQTDSSRDELMKIRGYITAIFGLTYRLSELMRRELVWLLVLFVGPRPKEGQLTHPAYGKIHEELQAGSFAVVVQKLQKYYGDKMPQEVADAVKKRNFLAHNFWYVNMDAYAGLKKPDDVFRTLKESYDLFSFVDEWASDEVKKKQKELRIDLEPSIKMNENYEPPAPTERDDNLLAKKMQKHPQKLIRVWRHPAIGMHLFELENGTLWRLGQCGLEISGYVDLSDKWQQLKILDEYLPSNIDLCPNTKAFGEYALPLKGDVELRIFLKNGYASIAIAPKKWSISDG